MSLDLRIFWGFVLVLMALGALAFWGAGGRRRAEASRAEQLASLRR